MRRAAGPDRVAIAGHQLEVLPPRPPAPGAPWLVYLHEGLGSAGLWRDFPDKVSEATGAGAFIYSRWGYGGSEARPRPWPGDFLEPEARDTLPALLTHAGISRPVIYGHSDGATVALLYAAMHPDSCAGVISVAAHVMLEDISLQGIAETRRRYLDGTIRDALRRQHGAHTDDTVLGWTESWLSFRSLEWDMRALLAAITCPVLVIQGTDDHFGTLAQVDAICRGVSGPVSSLILPDCGHVPHREKPKEVLAAVRDFIGGI